MEDSALSGTLAEAAFSVAFNTKPISWLMGSLLLFSLGPEEELQEPLLASYGSWSNQSD